MNLGTVIMGTISVSACVLPIILTNSSKNKAKKQLLNELKEYANKNNCTIHQHEICGKYIIGIDNEKKCVFFESRHENELTQQFVNLLDVRECLSVRKSKNIANYGSVIDRLALSFIPKSANGKKIELEFYNEEVSSQLVGEVQSLEKWNSIINKEIKK